MYAIYNLKSKILNTPESPGVYRFLDKNGKILYIGKAKNLRARIKQYFSGHDNRPQIPFLIKEAANFDYTVVNNELESLYLENTLIKQYLPKYNILLRDDKNYAFIKIDYSTEIPQIGYARRVEGAGLRFDRTKKVSPHLSPLTPKFFGPYSATHKIRDTLHLTRKIFPYCSATKISNKPCFHYHLHRCPGVCIGKISLEEYFLQLKKIENFLAGNTSKITKQITTEMRLAAAKKQFEKAARLRDQLNSLRLLDERQTVILAKKVDWDIISSGSSDGYSCVNLFKVREGKLRDKENFVYELGFARRHSDPKQSEGEESLFRDASPPAADQDDAIDIFLEQYYLETSDIPKTIYTQIPAGNEKLIQNIISSRTGRKIKIICPQKGKPKELIKLGTTNAQEHLNKWLPDQAGHLPALRSLGEGGDKINQALEGLKTALNLPDIPKRIECYDISNIQGTNAVGSMVVFENGLPKKSEYRKFKIRGKSTPDDFAMMKEMLQRRAVRIKNQELSKNDWPIPDLIVIDGGRGQLSAAMSVLSAIPHTLYPIKIIGLAKRIEEIFVPKKSEPIILSQDDPALQLLQRLRDEAHRFGITFHRDLRSKQAIKSALDDIPGIGPKTKKLLKAKFGTVAEIHEADLASLAALVGEKIAAKIKKSL